MARPPTRPPTHPYPLATSEAGLGLDLFDYAVPFPSEMEISPEAWECMAKIMHLLIPDWNKNISTCDTPLRFLKYLAEFRQPFNKKKVFGSIFDIDEGDNEIIVQKGIPFRMMCEHHLLPAFGTAALGYIPKTRILGLSKMARLVDAVAVERPSLQEHIAKRIVNHMEESLKPLGTMLIIKAQHGCMACRGVNKPNVDTVTSTLAGVFRTDPAARQEFLTLAGSI